MPKLKVFTTQMGFYDLAVATTSQAKALAAWGVHQDLFSQGTAGISSDPAVVDAALAKPEMVLRRAVGTREPFAEHARVGERVQRAPASRKRAPRNSAKKAKGKKVRHGRS